MSAPLRNMRVFCVVARKLSFKQASVELNLTPSAVSHQIRDLETWFNVSLFERKPREVMLTAAGSALYHEILPHFSSIETIAERYRSDTEQPCLTVELPEFFASEMFMPKIGEFSAANPNIDLQIETIQPDEDSPDQADIRIFLTDQPVADHDGELLFPMSMVATCSKERHSEWVELGASVLDTQTLLTHSTVPDSWQQWTALAGMQPPKPTRMIKMDSQNAIARAAQEGVGAALVPLPLCDGWLESGILVPLFPHVLESSQHYYVSSAKHTRYPEERDKLRHWINQTFRQEQREG